MWVRRVVAGFLAAIGACIVGYFVQDEWNVEALVLGTGILLLIVAAGLTVIRTVRETGLAVAWGGSAALGLAVVVAPLVAAELAGGSLDDWIPIYIAGAFGGLVSELVAKNGCLEVPGPAARSGPTAAGDGDGEAGGSSEADPSLLPEIDLGVCGRLLLGGLAAVVALMLVAAAGDDDTADALTNAADADVSVAWALASGAASAAIWTTIQQLAKARLGVLQNIEAGLGGTAERLEQQSNAATQGADDKMGSGTGRDAVEVASAAAAVRSAQRQVQALVRRMR